MLADMLAGAGINAEAVQDGRDVFTDPELIHCGHYVRIHHSVLGDCDMPAPPMTFSEAATHVGPPPRLGEHNHHVFVDWLGIPEAEVAELIQAGALW